VGLAGKDDIFDLGHDGLLDGFRGWMLVNRMRLDRMRRILDEEIHNVNRIRFNRVIVLIGEVARASDPTFRQLARNPKGLPANALTAGVYTLPATRAQCGRSDGMLVEQTAEACDWRRGVRPETRTATNRRTVPLK
jgi:hypothetical protein